MKYGDLVVRVDRLRKMADFLEQMPKQSEKCLFDINKIATATLVRNFNNGDNDLAIAEYDCGSHGCVIGWTPVAFKGEPGLSFTNHGFPSLWFRDEDGSQQTTTCYNEVGSLFYGVSEAESEYLFDSSSYWHDYDSMQDATDQATAIFRLRQVADHWEQTGQHYTCKELGAMIEEHEQAEQAKYEALVETREIEDLPLYES